MNATLAKRIRVLVTLALAALAAGCERPPVESVQNGFRGTGQVQVYNPRLLEEQQLVNQVPETIPPIPDDGGPRASQVYQNVKVLGHLSASQFIRTMAAITAWVAPEQGCAYCHVGANFADDGIYTKIVSRQMIQMTQDINQNWKAHVGNTGVTCYTCHRGNNVPQNIWFTQPEKRGNMVGNDAGQNKPSESVGLTTLPYDPFTPYLLNDESIRVAGSTALPSGNRQSIKQTEWTYGLMAHMSKSLGVNCTFCHNSRLFQSWEQSPPQRLTAWHGIRMAREVNNTHLVPLTAVFPPNRLGPTGDVAKLNCATCHQGAYKPLYGASMLQAHPELSVLQPSAAKAATAAPTGNVNVQPETVSAAAAVGAAPYTVAPAGTLVR